MPPSLSSLPRVRLLFQHSGVADEDRKGWPGIRMPPKSSLSSLFLPFFFS